MPLVLEAVLVGQDGEHALQPLVGEFHDPATALADEVLVVGLCRHRLVPLETFAEVVGSHQPAFYQQVERSVHGGGTHPLALLLELPTNRLDGKVISREEYNLCHEIALTGNRLVVFPEVTAEALGVGGCL